MVRKMLFLCFLPFLIFSQDVTITVSMEGEKGSISVTHDENVKINTESFRLEGKPLKVHFIKEVKISPNDPLVVSLYDFQKEEKKAGLYVLSEISVKVGDKIYKSIPTSYEIKDRFASKINQDPQTQVILNLEPFVEGKEPFYPGQRLVVGYRYTFNLSFDLTTEKIPLLEGEGFKKIGDKEFKDFTKDALTTLIVTQLIEATKPGVYTFGPSEIRGRPYNMNALGKKEYFNREYSAKAPDITVRVVPFPDQNKPPSFYGAIGDFKFDFSLVSRSDVYVGDRLIVLIKITGKGDMENLQMPHLCCQPGFSGFFKIGDLPSIELSGNKKTWSVELRPQWDEIKEIPSLEFSFFNPETKQYTVLKSQSIPITVKPWQGQESTEPLQIPVNIEIEGNYPLSKEDKALESYEKGDFNQALTLYKKEDKSGELYYNLGNTYYQLGQYPWAIFYYYRALSLRPGDIRIENNLKVTQEKLEIPLDIPSSFFGFNHFFSPIEGVIVKSVSMKGVDKPLYSGLKVTVLDVQDKGNLIKIRTGKGEEGFIPADSIRFLALYD